MDASPANEDRRARHDDPRAAPDHLGHVVSLDPAIDLKLGPSAPGVQHRPCPRDLIQRLRDEAHRFAIGSHRARRTKAIGVSPLDEIAGIGPLRKKALLQSFGSAKAVSRASVGDLASVEGVSSALAQAIYDHFHEGSG